MPLTVKFGAAVLSMLLLAGCSLFEVAEHGEIHDHGENSPTIEGAPTIPIIADAMAFEPASLELTVGHEYNLTLRSADVLHDLTIDEVDFHIASGPNEEVTGGIVFKASGVYIAYCAVPGHREAGMEMEITVR